MYACWRTTTVNVVRHRSVALLRRLACVASAVIAVLPLITLATAETGRRTGVVHGSEQVTGRSRSAQARTQTATQPSTRADARTLTFDATCAPGRRAVIAAVGDLLFHDALQAQALRPGQTFRAFWSPLAALLAGADLTYGNLESPIAAGVGPGGIARSDPGRVLDGVVYGRRSAELVFNTHPSVAADLVASGFDVVSTANNHTADRGALGMERTLDALASAGLAQTGLRRARDASQAKAWSTQTRTADGLNVAWLACTYGLNGMRDPHNQVLHCYRDLDVVTTELRALAADPAIDAVVFTPHWGIEGATAPQAADRGLARHAIDAGATAVIGTHPHILQPWEKHVTHDGREGLIVYSTGNFISNQKSDEQRTGVVALLEITRPDQGRARLSAAGFVPTYVQMSGNDGHSVTEFLTTSDAIRRLPAGNRVAMARYRDLPRACTSPEPDNHPPAVASTTIVPRSAPPVPMLDTVAGLRMPASTTSNRALDAPRSPVLDPIPATAEATAAPVSITSISMHDAPGDQVDQPLQPAPRERGRGRDGRPVLVALASDPFVPRRTPLPLPSRQDPVRTARWRLDRLLSDARNPLFDMPALDRGTHKNLA
jgi:hypothetical protein